MYIDLGAAKGVISIHAPLTGSDPYVKKVPLSVRISIHAPLTGSDGPCGDAKRPRADFNPRSPYGERRCCNHE